MSSDKRIQYFIPVFALAILVLVTLACVGVATSGRNEWKERSNG